MTAQPTIAFIGAGNMATSLIGGLITNGYPAEKIWASNPLEDQCKALEQHFNVQTTADNQAAAKSADIVVLSVKPQLIPVVAAEIATIVQEKRLLVLSIAAGIPTDILSQWLGKTTPIVRCMPNLSALIQCSASALFANNYVTTHQKTLAESIIRAVGIAVWLTDEEQMDTVTALSGSGPAYFFLLMEILEQTAAELGLPTDVARLLTLQTGLGAARLALESEHTIAELREKVTSSGGTTEAALQVLTAGNLRKLIADAVHAAKKRAHELSLTKVS